MGNGIKPTIYSHFTLGDMAAYYMLEKEDNQIELLLIPTQKEKELTEYLVKGLEKIENITTYLPLEDSHIGIVAFNIEGYKAEDVGTILDQDYHIAVRTGYHCAPLIHKYLMDIEKGGVVRASVGRYTTRDDIEKLLEAVEELSEEM